MGKVSSVTHTRYPSYSFIVLSALVSGYFIFCSYQYRWLNPAYHFLETRDLDSRYGEPSFTPDRRHLVKAEHGAVACDVPICSKMGTEILMKNGSAADAAVTVALCIGVVNSHSSGIGGGGFIVSKPFGEDAMSIDAREMAPGAAYRDMFNYREDLAKYGGLASGIPGELKGLDLLYKTHGSGNLKWEELIEPVAKLAREGWSVSEVFARALASLEPNMTRVNVSDWEWAMDRHGHFKRQGDFINRPQYLDTLSMIAKNGSSDIFYDPNGPIAQSLALKVQSSGGILTAEDFTKYNLRVEQAMTTNISADKYQVFSAGGASSGIALISGLNVMDQFKNYNGLDMKATDLRGIESQRLVETFKWMASVRSNLGDLNIYSKNDSEIADHLTRYDKFQSLEWAEKTYKMINDSHTLPSWKDYDPAYEPNDPHGTSHFSIVDKDDNAVLMTTTVNLILGSLVHDPQTGIVMNDEMDDFSIPTAPNAFGLQPSIYNWIEPFKRPLSSTAPSIIIDKQTGKPDFVIGCAGGSRILTLVLQAIVRKYHYRMDLLDIISRPRLHHQLLPEILYIEHAELPQLYEEMKLKGHEVEMISPVTAMNGILYNDCEDQWEAVSDYWRKRGELYGY